MKCPRCYSEIPFGKTCPKCGAELHFGGNTEFLQGVNEGQIRVREIFSQTFKRHQKGDAFRSLTRHPVPAAEMLESWQRPWLYLQLFAILAAATLILSFASSYIMPGDKAFAMIGYVIGGMVVPMSMLLFIWEMNMQGNVSIFSLTAFAAWRAGESGDQHALLRPVGRGRAGKRASGCDCGGSRGTRKADYLRAVHPADLPARLERAGWSGHRRGGCRRIQNLHCGS